jgi:hypothetical protein
MCPAANLIQVSDKIVALQGIATRAQDHIGGQYFAGLWNNNERDLLWNLLWCADPSDRERKRNERYLAPSWSWVSVNGRIEMSTLESIMEAQDNPACSECGRSEE